MSVTCQLVTARGRFYGAVAVLSEATEQVRYRQLQASLVTNVSHEIRTPLNAVLGLSQALQREPLTATQHELNVGRSS